MFILGLLFMVGLDKSSIAEFSSFVSSELSFAVSFPKRRRGLIFEGETLSAMRAPALAREEDY